MEFVEYQIEFAEYQTEFVEFHMEIAEFFLEFGKYQNANGEEFYSTGRKFCKMGKLPNNVLKTHKFVGATLVVALVVYTHFEYKHIYIGIFFEYVQV